MPYKCWEGIPVKSTRERSDASTSSSPDPPPPLPPLPVLHFSAQISSLALPYLPIFSSLCKVCCQFSSVARGGPIRPRFRARIRSDLVFSADAGGNFDGQVRDLAAAGFPGLCLKMSFRNYMNTALVCVEGL
ncbi:hypothetical protein ACLOJK_009275 [Asimina triloba]